MNPHDETTENANNTPTDVSPEPTPTKTPVSEPELIDATTPETAETKPAYLNFIIGGVVAVVILVLAYVLLFTDSEVSNMLSFSGNTVATVNGISIGRLEYENSVKNVTDMMTAQGFATEPPEAQELIQSEALQQLINTELLLQAALEAGYVINDDDVSKQIVQLETDMGGEEFLLARLEELGIDEEKLREDIGEQIIVNEYLGKDTELGTLAASDEEIGAFYENLKPQFGDELPPLEDVRGEISNEIISQKHRDALGSILANLRAEAEVEIKI